MKMNKRTIFSAIVLVAMTVSSAVFAESAKCSPCQAAKSARDAHQQSIKDAAAGKLSREAAFAASELDAIPSAADVSRAPREELVDPCGTCGTIVDAINMCRLNEQLCALRKCCCMLNERLEHQGRDARKCCKRVKHELNEIEELVESVIDQSTDCCSVTESLLVSVIDQSAECCSVIETVLGDPAGSALDLPLCVLQSSITDVVNSIDADVITWLKSLYILMYNQYTCTCCAT
jgi:hypothetical protein